MIIELDDFVKGKTTRKGEPLPPDEAPQPFVATVVTRDSIHDFLGSRTDRERDAHLRKLRTLGILVTEPGRLSQRVRTGSTKPNGWPKMLRCYVFRGGADYVPRIRATRSPVIYWD